MNTLPRFDTQEVFNQSKARQSQVLYNKLNSYLVNALSMCILATLLATEWEFRAI